MERLLIDMKVEELLERERRVGKVGTLPGIKSKYEYICKHMLLDSIAVSVFVVIFVDFDKYRDEKACLHALFE